MSICYLHVHTYFINSAILAVICKTNTFETLRVSHPKSWCAQNICDIKSVHLHCKFNQ